MDFSNNEFLRSLREVYPQEEINLEVEGSDFCVTCVNAKLVDNIEFINIVNSLGETHLSEEDMWKLTIVSR